MVPGNNSVGEGSVNFTVKELLLVVDGKIDKLTEKLDTKVNAVDFAPVKKDVEELKSFKSKAYGALAIISGLAGAGVFHSFFG